MNRNKALVFLSIIMALIFVAGCRTDTKDNNLAPDDMAKQGKNQVEDNVVDEKNNYVDLEEAKDIALMEVNNKNGIIVDYELEGSWNNYTHHEFEIQLDDEKREVKIDVKTGDVIRTESKKNNHKIAEYKKYIGFDEAKKIVFDNVNDKNGVITGFDLENHNKENKGVYYEFEIHTENNEYKVKVDAESGEII